MVTARAVRSLRGPIRVIICSTPCCAALSVVRQPLSVVCGSRQSLWSLIGHCLSFQACVAIAWADRSLCGHCTGPFRLLPAVRRAILHYLPCGSHYLLWTDMDSHCGHCAGIICHPWACEVVVRTVGHSGLGCHCGH